MNYKFMLNYLKKLILVLHQVDIITFGKIYDLHNNLGFKVNDLKEFFLIILVSIWEP